MLIAMVRWCERFLNLNLQYAKRVSSRCNLRKFYNIQKLCIFLKHSTNGNFRQIQIASLYVVLKSF